MKVRYGFVTNSSSSSFILKSSDESKPYTKEDIRNYINLWNNRLSRTVEENKDYIISDSKDDNEIRDLFDKWAYWSTDNVELCPLNDYSILESLGIRHSDLVCDTCTFKSTCTECDSTILNMCKEADLFIIGGDNSLPAALMDNIINDFDIIYCNTHMG